MLQKDWQPLEQKMPSRSSLEIATIFLILLLIIIIVFLNPQYSIPEGG